MKTESSHRASQRGSSLIVCLIFVLIVASAIATVALYSSQTTSLARRRHDMVAAIQFSQGGAVISCSDLNAAVTTAGTVAANLTAKGYTLNSSASTSATKVYQRTINSPFTSQTVTTQVRLPNTPSPINAQIVATAKTGNVTQSATVNVMMAWGYPAAIISTSAGTKSTSVSKSTAQDGNVVVAGDKNGPIIVDGNVGKAVLANGQVNLDPAYANIPASAISKTNYNTADEIPDYTTQGKANMLFDFGRIIALSEATQQLPTINPNKTSHFTNLATFITGNNLAATMPAKSLEGVIVVEIHKSDPDLTPTMFPNGINVKGTLFFNFDSSFGPLSKIINTATMNINPANLSGLVATNPATFPSGYPPVYYDSTKNPTNIDISAKGYANVLPGEDMPALLYSIGVLDIHGNANVSGVMYTPSNMEIENKKDGQIQYFKGSLIMGLGIYFENNQKSTSIISFDNKAVDSLSTLFNAGKQVAVTYWQ